jgi:hypothetical protein
MVKTILQIKNAQAQSNNKHCIPSLDRVVQAESLVKGHHSNKASITHDPIRYAAPSTTRIEEAANIYKFALVLFITGRSPQV